MIWKWRKWGNGGKWGQVQIKYHPQSGWYDEMAEMGKWGQVQLIGKWGKWGQVQLIGKWGQVQLIKELPSVSDLT